MLFFYYFSLSLSRTYLCVSLSTLSPGIQLSFVVHNFSDRLTPPLAILVAVRIACLVVIAHQGSGAPEAIVDLTAAVASLHIGLESASDGRPVFAVLGAVAL